MFGRFAVRLGIACVVLTAFALANAQNTQPPAQGTRPTSPAGAAAVSRIPPYHAGPPKGPLPATLDPKMFPDPLNQKIYALAAREKKVLYQQPCYCGCDREVGHKSLLDCYVDRHASICAACKMEAVFVYQEHRRGRTAAQIREEIIAGKWRTVDLSPYSGARRAR